MKISKKIKLSLLSLVIGLSFVGCSKNEAKSEDTTTKKVEKASEAKDNHYPVTITTHNSNKEEIKVTIKKNPKRRLQFIKTL